MMTKDLPIGIFDSGVGGLTVLRAIKDRLPAEDLLYLGDTARLPYGTKSKSTVSRYALQASARLVELGIKLLVVACNTATAAALEDLRAAWPTLPILGVIDPGARAACTASKNGHIAVIATEGTIKNEAYHQAIQKIAPNAQITGKACSLFVSLAEEGWIEGPEAEGIARRYLDPIFSKNASLLTNPGTALGEAANTSAEENLPDCLVLGCTHFPPFAPLLAKVAGSGVAIVDSAATTADAVKAELARLDLLHGPEDRIRNMRFMTTDDTARFAKIGKLFLGGNIQAEDVELINL